MSRFAKLVNIVFHVHSIGGTGSRAVAIHGRLPAREEADFVKVKRFIKKLYTLDRQSPERPIIMVVRSQGGDANTENLMHELLVHRLRAPVYTVTDCAGSASAILFIGGEEGRRYLISEDVELVLHGSYVSVGHEPIKWWQLLNHVKLALFAIKVKRDLREIKAALDKDNAEMLYHLTGHNKTMLQRLGDWSDEEDREKIIYGITRLLEEDQYFNTEEAIACGLADEVIDKKRLRELISGLD